VIEESFQERRKGKENGRERWRCWKERDEDREGGR
jgi:hypothetical protein